MLLGQYPPHLQAAAAATASFRTPDKVCILDRFFDSASDRSLLSLSLSSLFFRSESFRTLFSSHRALFSALRMVLSCG